MNLSDIVKNNLVVNLKTLTNDNELVKEIQTRLSAIGLLQLSDVDGIFGSLTQEALTHFCKLVFLNNMSTNLFGSSFAKKLIEFRGPVKDNHIVFKSADILPDALATALKFTLLCEGGFVDNPLDFGGATNRGITQRTYDTYRISQRIPTESVNFITDAEVHEIYQEQYWKPSQSELMVLPLAVVQFDTAVLFGVSGAIKFLQEALEITADGIFGLRTKAIMDANNNRQTALKMIDGRKDFHQQVVNRNSSQEDFLDGWLNRADDLRTFISNL